MAILARWRKAEKTSSDHFIRPSHDAGYKQGVTALSLTFVASVCPGECATHMPKKLGLQQLFGNRWTIDAQGRPVAAIAQAMRWRDVEWKKFITIPVFPEKRSFFPENSKNKNENQAGTLSGRRLVKICCCINILSSS